MAIEIKSFNQILGEMVRKIIAETPLNDVNTGSILLTLLEAAASNDFENNTAILNILELLSIDAIRNNDLDARAADFGLSRRTAIKASGFVSIYNTNITKRSTGLYVIKPAPIAGQTTIYVNNTDGWSGTGNIYIGIGTTSFEGPIAYTAITQYPTYSVITLASALQKDHLISDVVIDAQGQSDIVIPAGTVVKIPANNLNPEIQYTTLRDAVIPAGEDTIDSVEVVATIPGSRSNAGINTITAFESTPFTGAEVSNTSAFTDGKDVETDTELRNRIKSYTITLARGTSPSIIESVIGVSDSTENKQVASAILTEPVRVGDPSILYIDDGSGFQPSYEGQSVDLMLASASGTEEFLQLANYPLPRPQAVNTDGGPYTLQDGSFISVSVDGKEETIYFDSTQFNNIAAATISEVVVAINESSIAFKARLANNSSTILLYPIAHDAETIQVSALKSTDNEALYANSVLKFPTDEFSYISIYQNSTRLREKSSSATLETTVFSSWNISVASNIIITVDGTPGQDRLFALADFPGASSFSTLTLDDWVTAFNSKFAGLTAEATPSQTLKITSNRVGETSSIEILGGTLLSKWFSGLDTSDVGQTAQFQLNRQTGNIRILTDINAGDSISAGVEDAKGFAISSVTTSGNYNVSTDASGRSAEMIVVADSTYCNQVALPTVIGQTFDVTAPSSNTMRLMTSSTTTFASVLPGEYIFIVTKSAAWFDAANSGLFQVKAKGQHTNPGVDTYVDVVNVGTVVESGITVLDSLDMKAFSTDGLPQIWRGSYASNPPSEPITSIVTSLNSQLLNINATVYKSNSIKMTSTTEKDGSIAIPVSMANMSQVFAETSTAQAGNPPHIANRVPDTALMSMVRFTDPNSDDVWLNRHTYTNIKAPLTANAVPDSAPFSGTYSESIESLGIFTTAAASYKDYISFNRGANKGHFKSIKAFLAGDIIGTQQGTARTIIDHSIGDETQVIKPINISSEDSIVMVLDNDATSKTVDISLSRTGRVNSGSGMLSFFPTTTELSAYDQDNEPGIDFSNAAVWGTVINSTDFSDYAMWMRSRNWYISGGVGSGLGHMIVRAAQYGPNGDRLRFSMEYPTSGDQDAAVTHVNTPTHSHLSYYFGSGAARAIALTPGDTIAVKGPYPDSSTNFPNGSVSSGEYFDYTFSAGNFASVVTGDVLSILSSSGVSTANSGQFRVANKSGFTLRLRNLNASSTSPGGQEISTITTIADVVGTPTAHTIDTVADIAGSLHLTYFTIYDTAGSVAVWFDVDNTGAPPPPHGASRAIKVATIVTGDTANTVATKIGQVIALDSAFTVGVITNQVTITNVNNGPTASASAGTSGFTAATSAGSPDNSLNGKYFTLYDENGSVAVWFDVGSSGTPEPFHGANRSIRVSSINFGDSANTVASAIAAAIALDLEFTAISALNVVTITSNIFQNLPNATAGTSGFGVSSADGSLPASEAIVDAGAVLIFPLTGTAVSDITTTINDNSDVIKAVGVGNTALTIERATRDEDYIYGGDSTALGFGHDPSDTTYRNFIYLYDGEAVVKSFQNTNPNFTLKSTLTLNTIAPTAYSMDTCPNHDTSDLGELFKLIPVTVKNIYHHMTQKALSQLPIVANIKISSDRKNVQISSKNLGSDGSIEVIGGNGNKAQAFIIGESELTGSFSNNTMLAKVSAYPDTFNIGDVIKLENESGVKRLSRLLDTDTIDLVNTSGSNYEYRFNAKATNINSGTSFTITDVSSFHGRPAGTVWRWTHDGTAILTQVQAGDVVMAFGPSMTWSQGNMVRIAGDNLYAGLPIINVNEPLNYFDVVNPIGEAMPSTPIGVGNTVQVCPTPVIQWLLKHSARSKIVSMSRLGSTVTVTCYAPHLMSSGDSVDIIDSDNIVDGAYSPVTVINPTQFSFTSVGPAFSELDVGASAIKTSSTPTKYRIEKLGFKNMLKLSRESGDSPRFYDCGVAVDDYIVISGNSFGANNNGRFRVHTVDNDSIIFTNELGSEILNTYNVFNNKSYKATWTANSNTVTGIAGTFKYVQIGDWVKKSEDADSLFRQVTAMDNTPELATQITLGSNYSGSSSDSMGVSCDQVNDYDKGAELLDVRDIEIFEGDSAVSGDTLFVQNIVDPAWFTANNIGSFAISEVGTDPTTYLPFIRITNDSGTAQSGILMSVNKDALYIIESYANKFYSYRTVTHAVLDELNETKRSLYLSPNSRVYKFSEANKTYVMHMGKLNYSTNITTGVDGYLYYTGLLQKVQRIVDGYEPDANNYPGRRAVGGIIETLPPLIKVINVAVNVTTNDGVNLGDITNNIKSAVINYIQTLGVGEDVIISEMIAAIMQIKGVAAVTFTNPVPSTERISVAENEKATISPDNIGIS